MRPFASSPHSKSRRRVTACDLIRLLFNFGLPVPLLKCIHPSSGLEFVVNSLRFYLSMSISEHMDVNNVTLYCK